MSNCNDCNTNAYQMSCIYCAARHCRSMFYPTSMNKWEYVKAVARKYGHSEDKLIETIKGMKSEVCSGGV